MRYKLYDLDNKFIKEIEVVPNNFTGIVECRDGTKQWFIDGISHRLDGPAFIVNGSSKFWYINGKQVTELQHKLLCDIMKLKGIT